MDLFDDVFDPGQFQDSGGLLGRLLSLPPQLNLSQSGADDANPQDASDTRAVAPSPSQLSQLLTGTGGGPASSVALMPSPGPAQGAAGPTGSALPASADNSQAVPPAPDVGARLGAGLQSWAQTPAGNPFAALANGITGFNNAANSSSNGTPASTPAQSPDLGDRLGAAFQSWAHTPVGSPFAGLANGITGFNTGQQTPAATAAPAQAQTPTQASDPGNRPSPGIQNQANATPVNMVPSAQIRKISTRRWPPPYQ
jgi:hypothetical protein